MLECGKQLRVTLREVQELSEIHLDLSAVKSRADLSEALVPWLLALGEVRPDLLEKLAHELAKATGTTGPTPLPSMNPA